MTSLLSLLGTFVLFALWQSTFWLAAALVCGRMYRQMPWKNHILCVTGIFAATFTPLLSTIISVTEGGILPFANPLGSDQMIERIEPAFIGQFCLAGMLLFLAVLLYGIASSRKLMFRAVPFPDQESQHTLLRHSKRLRNVSLPVLFTSPNIKSPTVWCWGLHPAVLLPESLATQLRDAQRDAVFLHELSHISRRDHLTSLFARCCGALLFWNPLYWLVLWQSDLAADESCDLTVLAQSNILPEQYTDVLLRLVAGERPLPILQFLSRKEKMMKRIDQILSFTAAPVISPSRLWTASVFLSALLLSVTLAFCQESKQSDTERLFRAMLQLEGAQTYSVNKRIADFPDAPGLETPENAYATQKIKISTGITDKEFLKTYKEKFIVREVMTIGEYAFVIGYREYDKLYDCDILLKTENEWKHQGNLQDEIPEKLISEINEFCSRNKQETPSESRMAVIEKSDWFSKLNDQQKVYVQWDENVFAYAYDPKNYDVGSDRTGFEERWAAELAKPEPGNPRRKLVEYDRAIFGLAIIKSEKALKPLVKIAAERVFKDNAHRHYATKALGMLGNPAAIPDLIPLVYHFNFNTRWEAQVALVRLTGQNFGADYKAWGEWYTANQETLGKDLPKFDPAFVDWACGRTDAETQKYCDPAFQKEIDAAWFERNASRTEPKTPSYSRMAVIEKSDWYSKLTEPQKVYVQWDENTFAYAYNPKNYDVGDDRTGFEERWAAELAKPEPGYPGNTLVEYDKAIFGLAIIKSEKALKPLVKIAAERVFKDNAHRHYATKALGMLGNPAAIPKLIPLVYHFNFNTRWDAQIALVRLTGQNFGADYKAWGEWYTANQETLGKDLPKFDPAFVDWSCGNTNAEVLKHCDPAFQKERDAAWFESNAFSSDVENVPTITKMEPLNGSENVDSATVKELRVTFNRDMSAGCSWCGSGEMFPKVTDKPKWIDMRTCVLLVALEPGKTYRIGINAPSFKNFRSAEGVPVVPVLYSFSTKE